MANVRFAAPRSGLSMSATGREQACPAGDVRPRSVAAWGAGGTAIVEHDKELARRMRESRQARRLARALAAGIDAASMVRRCLAPLNRRECFQPPAGTSTRQGGLGFRS